MMISETAIGHGGLYGRGIEFIVTISKRAR
jgi:hypothetical protein